MLRKQLDRTHAEFEYDNGEKEMLALSKLQPLHPLDFGAS